MSPSSAISDESVLVGVSKEMDIYVMSVKHNPELFESPAHSPVHGTAAILSYSEVTSVSRQQLAQAINRAQLGECWREGREGERLCAIY